MSCFRSKIPAGINHDQARGFERGMLPFQVGNGKSVAAHEQDLEVIVEQGTLKARCEGGIVLYED